MDTIQEVRAYLEHETQKALSPERLMADALKELADRCESVEEFLSHVPGLWATLEGLSIEQSLIAKEYCSDVLLPQIEAE
jgi:hypothetical protein